MISCRLVRIRINLRSSCKKTQDKEYKYQDGLSAPHLPIEIHTPSPPSTSSNPVLHAATMRPTALAYFFPCSPSKTTPECRMIDGGVARDSTNTPKTVLFDESIWRVASSSGGAGAM